MLTIPLNPDPHEQGIHQSQRTGTRSLTPEKTFLRRPLGAIFGDRFISESTIYSDVNQHRYQVREIDADEPEKQIRNCPNPTCGAIFPPRSEDSEKFCTNCGSALDNSLNEFLLIETISPPPTQIKLVVAKGLSHNSLRAPIMLFEETLAGQARYCLIAPNTQPIENIPSNEQVLEWGYHLARGLDYLHDNGISFQGKIDGSLIGLVAERPMWAEFSTCSHHPEGYITDRRPDVRALAMLLFYWLTGRLKYEPDPNLLPGPRKILEQALVGTGFSNAGELADALKGLLSQAMPAPVVDFRLGRRTHLGMVRTLNEDSLFTLELNRTQQSVSQPLGLFVVADGMGGHTAGEIASSTIVNVLANKAMQELTPDQNAGQDRLEWLRSAIDAANYEVFSLRKSAGTDMGSTLVAAIVEGDKAYIAHVGDSRIYKINAQGIQQLTVDHSLVERLIATNQITREEARNHPQRSVIYRTIGDRLKIDIETSTLDLVPDDYLLLCSDGLSGMLEDQLIQQTIIESASPQDACDELIASANRAGGDDNISAILIKLVKV